MVLVENLKFFHLLWRKLRQENVFADILKTKKSLLDYENKHLRKVKKIAIFPKGLVLGFGKKPEISPCFYFSQNRPENVIDDIIERKKPF